MKTLIILNPHAKGGRLFSHFHRQKKKLEEIFKEVEFFGSTQEKEVLKLKERLKEGFFSQIISAGGDGTNNFVLNNLIMPLNLKIPFGNLPIGTGSDWARALSIPKKLEDFSKWLKESEVVDCDLGVVEYEDKGILKKEYFLNIASFGLSGKVASIVNNWHMRGKTSFFRATILALLTYKPSFIDFKIEGKEFIKGKLYLIVLANGPCFGGGMWIAPKAKINDGMLEVIVAKNSSFMSFVKGLLKVFKGKHLTHPSVLSSRGEEFLLSSEKLLDFEMDGEDKKTNFAKIYLIKDGIKLILNPQKAPMV